MVLVVKDGILQERNHRNDKPVSRTEVLIEIIGNIKKELMLVKKKLGTVEKSLKGKDKKIALLEEKLAKSKLEESRLQKALARKNTSKKRPSKKQKTEELKPTIEEAIELIVD